MNCNGKQGSEFGIVSNMTVTMMHYKHTLTLGHEWKGFLHTVNNTGCKVTATQQAHSSN